MNQAETLHSARQLSKELGITLQMLSVYAKCYTQLTKTQISKQGRLGRHFTESQRQVIRNAREMVQNNTGMTVDEAMRKALVFDAGSLEAPVQVNGAQIDLGALQKAFGEALRQEVTAPLVSELKALRAEVETLKLRQLDSIEQTTQPAKDDVQDGLLVQLAKRLESLLRRR
jgi:hypothetical protein